VRLLLPEPYPAPGAPPPCPQPRTLCQPPGPSALAPVVLYQGWPPAPHGPVMPGRGPPEPGLPMVPHHGLTSAHPIPREVPDAQGWGRPGARWLPCSGLGEWDGPGCWALPCHLGGQLAAPSPQGAPSPWGDLMAFPAATRGTMDTGEK